jgi:hydrogenase-1 operon protein HyaE
MPHPLIRRLTDELGWPLLTNMEDVDAFVGASGVHVLFVPGDPQRNLETPDVAVILPELEMAFQGRFDCAVVGETVDEAVRESTKVFKTPSLIFFRDGQMIGALPKVRDWAEYVERITQVLNLSVAAE